MSDRTVPRLLILSRRPGVKEQVRRAAAGLRPCPRLDDPARSGDPPPLVLVDLGAPPDRLEALRKESGTDARLVALVDAPASERLIEALSNGCDDYLFFPVNEAELRLLWRRHLEGDEPPSEVPEEVDAERLRLEFPSEVRYSRPAVEQVVEACRARAGLSERDAFRLRVALGEAVANAVLYGNREDPSLRVAIAARAAPGGVRVRVSDEGPGFDPEAVPDPTAPENLQRNRGRGLLLMRRLVDELRFNDRGNEVTLTVRSGPSARKS